MRILVACEYSGAVRDAFIKRGHDAISCDLLPTESAGPHYQGDVRDIIDDGFDMMIAFPPCTYLCSSGLHWNTRRPERAALTEDAISFVNFLMNYNIPRIAIENPIGCISSRIRKPDQIIQPYQFGHPESKSTCLWLKGLPKLVSTNVIQKPKSGVWSNQTPTGQNKLGPSPDRWKIRSATYSGIAEAMAAQWSWEPVVFSADCGENGECVKCGVDFADCACLGPTMDDIEYKEENGVLFGRRVINQSENQNK